MDEQRTGKMLWRGRYLILLAVAAMLIVAVVINLTTPKSYQATTLLRIDQAAAPTNGSDAYNAQQASATQAVNYATLLTSTSFLQRVASKVDNGFAFSGAGLAGHVGAHAITNTNLIAMTFTAGSRKDALHYARAVADESIGLFKSDFVGTRVRQQAAIEARLNAIPAKIAALRASNAPNAQQQIEALGIETTDLTRQYGQAASEISSPSPVVLVAGPPSAPTSPVAPRPFFNAIVALVLGLLVGVGLAWLRDRLTEGERRNETVTKPLKRDPLAAAAPPTAPPTAPRSRAASRRKANP